MSSVNDLPVFLKWVSAGWWLPHSDEIYNAVPLKYFLSRSNIMSEVFSLRPPTT